MDTYIPANKVKRQWPWSKKYDENTTRYIRKGAECPWFLLFLELFMQMKDCLFSLFDVKWFDECMAGLCRIHQSSMYKHADGRVK